VEIPADNGITFDQSQTIQVDDVGNAINGSVTLSDKKITIAITGDSQDDEHLLVGTPDGSGLDNDVVSPLKFNVTGDSSASNVNLSVTTSPGAANVTQDTSTDAEGSSYDLDIANPTLDTNNGNDLVIDNDLNGETDVVSNNPDIQVTSKSSGDIASGSAGTNITVTIPSASPITFDTSQGTSASDLSFTGLSIPDNGEAVTVVDNRTIVITVDQDETSSSTDTITLNNIEYNVSGGQSANTRLTASVNRTDATMTSQSWINVTQLTANDLAGDAQSGGGSTDLTDFGGAQLEEINGEDGGTGDGDEVLNLNSVQTANLRLQNSSNTFDFGGADIDLNVSSVPSGETASDVTLNNSTITTAEDGTAAFNVTLGDVPGTYEVTASLASNSNVNVTLKWTTGPSMQTNSNGAKTIQNDRNGETGVTLATPDIELISNGNTDISSDAASSEIVVTIPKSSGITFDQTSSPSLSGNLAEAGDTVSVTNATALTVSLDASPASSNSDVLDIDGVKLNVSSSTEDSIQATAHIKRTGAVVTSANWINTSDVTPANQVEADAQSGDGFSNFGTQATEATDTSVSDGDEKLQVTSTQTGVIEVRNTTAGKTMGGETVNLEVTGTPSGVSASDLSFNVSDMSLTTDQNGVAAFNVTLGSKTGYYNVTATLATNSSYNTTLKWKAGAGEATKLNTTLVENSLTKSAGVDVDPTAQSSEDKVAVYKVRLEDAQGNLVQDTDVDAEIAISGGTFEAAHPEQASSGEASESALTDSDNDGLLNYARGSDSNNGDFYIYVSSESAQDITATVNPESSITADDATATVYSKVSSVNVALENASDPILKGDNVLVSAQPKNSAGTVVEVPRLSTTFSSSNTTVVADPADGSTNVTGMATTTVSVDDFGTSDIDATIKGQTGTQALTAYNESVTLNVSFSPSSPVAGDTVTFTVTEDVASGSPVENAELYYDGTKIGTTNASGQATHAFSTAGDKSVTATKGDTTSTQYDNGSATVTVDAPVGYTVSNLAPADETVQYGDAPIDFTVDVENIGDVAGNQTITLSITDAEGTEVLSDSVADVEIDAGNNTTVTLVDVDVGSLSTGEYNTTVSSDDSSVEGSLTVEAAPLSVDVSPSTVTANEQTQLTVDVTSDGADTELPLQVHSPAKGTVQPELAENAGPCESGIPPVRVYSYTRIHTEGYR